MSPAPKWLRGATTTSAQVFAGASTALLPITMQALAARGITLDVQATLALSISVGAFVSAVVNATVLETRLTSSRSRPLSYVPRWSTIAGLLGCIAILLTIVNPLGAVIGTPLAMVALSLGRTHGVITHRWRAEGHAGIVMVLGALGALAIMPIHWQSAVAALAICTAYTIVVRAAKQPGRSLVGPQPREFVKVGTETAVTALVPMVLNILVFALLTNADAIAFRMVLSVLGILQPLLGFLRTRLLTSRSISLTLVLGSASLIALAAVLTAHIAGLVGFVLGPSWAQVTTPALVLACLWKVASVPATVPFAMLRREGHLDALLRLRIVTSILFLTSGCLAIWIGHSLLAAFTGLFLAELLSTIIYFGVAYRAAAPPLPKECP